jgi:molybdenum cofactor cytidylyltransferase
VQFGAISEKLTAVLAAIVLAAGNSKRMGTPKALLSDAAGDAFVVRIARTFFAAGLEDLIVVTGATHEPVAEALARADLPFTPRLARNPDPSRGQLSSLWTGLDAAERPELRAVLMTLVDVPLVRAATVRAVVDAWRATGAAIVRPAIGDRHGHPVLFDRALFAELRAAPLDEGAKTVVHAHAHDVVNVAVDDADSLTDVDTPADYARLIGRSERR